MSEAEKRPREQRDTKPEANSVENIENIENIEKIVIVGGGPAAHTAAIYTSRAGMAPVLYEGDMAGGIPAGGQLMTTTHVENYPGFPDGIGGIELMDRMRLQSERFGTKIVTETVTHIDGPVEAVYTVHTKTHAVKTKTVIVATGASAKRMDIPGAGDSELWNKGVSACAVCDGALPLFRNKKVVVVGGGDTAMEEALFLCKFAEKVYVAHRRDELRASKIMQARAKKHPKIEILYSTVVTAAHGQRLLDAVTVKNVKDSTEKMLAVNGLFFAIGHKPSTQFLPSTVQKDDNGYVVVEPGSTRTNLEGMFCAGDAHDKKWRQAITAAGTGCMAALEAERYLEGLE